MQYALLPQRGVIAISGEDRVSFLQGLVSNDVTKLKPAKAVYAALLTPQGKFLHDFFLVADGERILLDCEKDRQGDLMQRLNSYKLRSKVTMEGLPDSVIAAWGNTMANWENHIGFSDPRVPQLGYRFIGRASVLEAWCKAQGWKASDAETYDNMRLSLGIPDGSRDMKVEKSFLHECRFEALHGVDFNKGCYVGQEVVARTQYRGQAKKFFYRIEAESGPLPEPGTPVMLADAEAGELRSHAHGMGIALLRAEEVEKAKAAGLQFQAGGKPLKVFTPDWAAA